MAVVVQNLEYIFPWCWIIRCYFNWPTFINDFSFLKLSTFSLFHVLNVLSSILCSGQFHFCFYLLEFCWPLLSDWASLSLGLGNFLCDSLENILCAFAMVIFSSSVHNWKCRSCHVVPDIFSFVFKHFCLNTPMIFTEWFSSSLLSSLFWLFVFHMIHSSVKFYTEVFIWLIYSIILVCFFLGISFYMCVCIDPDFTLFFYLCLFPLSLFMFSFIFELFQ